MSAFQLNLTEMLAVCFSADRFIHLAGPFATGESFPITNTLRTLGKWQPFSELDESSLRFRLPHATEIPI